MTVSIHRSPCANCPYRDNKGRCKLLKLTFAPRVGVKHCYTLNPPENARSFVLDFIETFRGTPIMARHIAKTYGVTLQRGRLFLNMLADAGLLIVFKSNPPRVYKIPPNPNIEKMTQIAKKVLKNLMVSKRGESL